MIVLSSTAEVRASKRRASSSIAKTMPASGVLNAAAMPAAPPAMTRSGARITRWFGSQRCASSMKIALIWTVGPSRPAENPANSARAPRNTLPTAMRIDSSRLTGSCLRSARVAAMAWGMPLPCEPGK